MFKKERGENTSAEFSVVPGHYPNSSKVMTDELKVDPTQVSGTVESSHHYKIEDLIDTEYEDKLLKQFLEIAFAPFDETWEKYNTKSSAIEVQYKFLPNDNLCTIRGSMDNIKGLTVEKYFALTENGYRDVFDWDKENDGMCTELTCTKVIDINHCVVYGSFDSGVFVISPRDFSFIQARRRFFACSVLMHMLYIHIQILIMFLQK